ncbi:MAG: V-type ATP synthase subunit I [Salinirussus sp.]
MLRPERMSRVSVTGSKRVMGDVIETVHDLGLLHVTAYEDDWAGFEPGDPRSGADEAATKLVTVRALESTLGIEDDDPVPEIDITDAELEERLEQVRTAVNEADDRRSELRTELRNVRDRIERMEPFVRLGIDLELLSGYDAISIEVGEGNADGVQSALDASEVGPFEIFAEDGVIAVAARAPSGSLQDALVNAPFTSLEVPEGEGDPEAVLSDLRQREEQLESRLETVENELEDLRHEHGGFLRAVERHLTITVDKLEAPLSFATTANAFIAEGWLPTDRYDNFETALHDAVGEHVEVTELERASYDEDGHVHEHEDMTGGSGTDPTGEPTAGAAETADEEVAADGGTVTMGDEDPPVVQDNPGPVKPFEALTEVINRPKYSELDPSVILFLTFPAFFGFMIGDFGYGILYVLIGYWLLSSFDSDIVKSLGGVAAWSGGFTILFGILYGEIFGLHLISTYLWEGILGLKGSPLHKGLQPAYAEFAVGWLVLSLLAGVVHLTIGWVFDFVENLEHGLMDAVTESGSWLLMMYGLWTWIFGGAFGKAPGLLVGSESVFNGHPFPLGFTGFDPTLGLVGLAVFGLGFVLLLIGEPLEGIEFLNVLVNVLSYTRLAAVLLAKGGMAFVVNLLFFGVFVTDDGAWHFGTGKMFTPAEVAEGVSYHGHEVTDVMFGGLFHAGIIGILVGLVILVLGHLLVLALGITSAGLQAIRLEYVEFFGKFFEGGGKPYRPFGRGAAAATDGAD